MECWSNKDCCCGTTYQLDMYAPTMAWHLHKILMMSINLIIRYCSTKGLLNQICYCRRVKYKFEMIRYDLRVKLEYRNQVYVVWSAGFLSFQLGYPKSVTVLHRNQHLQRKFWYLVNQSNDEPTKIGQFQSSESMFEFKYQLHLPENDFLLRILN